MIANYRTDEASENWKELRSWLSESQVFTEFDLKGLLHQEVVELVTNLLGCPPPEELDTKIVNQCAGNPFYIYEFLRFLQKKRGLFYQSGHWEWQATLDEPRIPSTVAETIQNRLKELEEQKLRTLQYLSVLQKPTKIDLFSRMVRMPISDLNQNLDFLESLDFVSVSSDLDEPTAFLSHDWLGQVIRSNLSPNPRQRIHQRIATTLEKEFVETLDPILGGPTVYHFLEAGDRAKTRKYLATAISWYEEAHLYKEAARLLETALERSVVSAKSWNWARKAVELFYLSGQLDKSIHLSERLLRFAELPDKKKTFIYSLLARIHLIRGQSAAAIEFLTLALPLLNDSEELDFLVEIQADLLCFLSRSGQFTRAAEVVRKVVDGASAREVRDSLEKLYHALWVYHQLTGDLAEALKWETRSVKLALEQGKVVRSAGRVNNLGICKLEIGALQSGRKLCYYSLEQAKDMGNLELVLYAEVNLCLHDRKQGRHKEVISTLKRLLHSNQTLNRNRYVEAELHIELAKNFNYLLLPERALSCLEQSMRILDADPVHASVVDATLARAWSWILLGCPDRALRVTSSLNWKEIPRERGRYFLVRAQAYLMLGDLKQGWKEACRAHNSFPAYMSYYRARARFVQSEITLAKGRLNQAGRYIEEALSLASDEFCFPLMVRGWTLKARHQLHEGALSLSRTYCLRALQIADKVDRPGARIDICHTLARVEGELGRRESAVKRLDEGLRILKERSLYVSTNNLSPFTKQFIEPLERDRNHLFSDTPRRPPRHLIQLRQLANLVREEPDRVGLAESILRVVDQILPGVAASVLLRDFSGGPFNRVASLGLCTRTGKHLIPKTWQGEQVLFPDSAWDPSGSICSVGIPLSFSDDLLGIIYLERRGGISEDEIDFLTCAASIARLQLAKRLQTDWKNTPARHALIVDDELTIIGEHPEMQRLFSETQRVARADSTVLILGESGTGKELVARAIHLLSRRHKQAFVPINCSALPEDLVESELFGHSRGSFTGAVADRRGLFEAASGGTLFLDEIATMPVGLQVRLLRVLQEKKIRRLGEIKERSVDVRILTATNQRLLDLMQDGSFREDLYHRLDVCQIRVPSLREHLSDIPLLVAHILRRLNKRQPHRKSMTEKALSRLSSYSFPGNVRELENIVESTYHLTEEMVITAKDVSVRLKGGAEKIERRAPSLAAAIVKELASKRVDFWQAVRVPFLNRDLSRQHVKEIVSLGLKECDGNYRRVVRYFNLPIDDYKRFLAFLSNHNCKVDFRPFRHSL